MGRRGSAMMSYKREINSCLSKACSRGDRTSYLEASPYKADGGQKVGKMPGSVGLAQLRALGHPESPIRAIRSKCLDCSGGVTSEIRKCVAVDCALWPFRTGSNPFHGKKEVASQLGPNRKNQ